MRNVFIIFISMFCMLVLGCVEEADLEKPGTQIIYPAEGDTLFTDEELRLVATLEDNGALNQYRLQLDGIDELNGLLADSAISRIFVDDLASDEFYIERVFDIPDTLMNGHYSMSMSAIDVAGNESVADTVDFFFKNRLDTVQPVFIDTVFRDTLQVSNNGIWINVDIYDDQVVYCRLTITHEESGFYIGGNEWVDFNYAWVNIDHWYPYTDDWPEGDFVYLIEVIDQFGYYSYSNSIYFNR